LLWVATVNPNSIVVPFPRCSGRSAASNRTDCAAPAGADAKDMQAMSVRATVGTWTDGTPRMGRF
jgi:hypothetical protein